jgi:hypothetical protein
MALPYDCDFVTFRASNLHYRESKYAFYFGTGGAYTLGK